MQLRFRATKTNWPPSYVPIWQWRQNQLLQMRQDRKLLLGAKAYYSQPQNFSDFICHWCDTYDPRNVSLGLPTRMPLLMFQRQVEFVEFLNALMAAEEDGLVEKARDMGATWVACAYSVCLWLFTPGVAVGWGSRKEILVDRAGDPSSIFEKIRMIVRGLPPEFLPKGFNPNVHFTHMKVINPETGATITGEAGDNIGRGGRTSIYFKDESAHYERPEAVEAALGDNTRVQVDISSVNGIGNIFHQKREAGVEWSGGPAQKGSTNIFVMDWTHHPGKTQEWYEDRRRKALATGLKHVFAQEVDRDYTSSVQGILIPQEHVVAAIDAHEKLGFSPTLPGLAALDVADEGGDKNAFAARYGQVACFVDEWGQGDTGFTTRKAVGHCVDLKISELQYDRVGVGAGVKAEAARLDTARREKGEEVYLPDSFVFVPWSGADAVRDPKAFMVPGDPESPRNEDFFENYKAQAWWHLARLFENTYRAVTEGIEFDEGDLISLPSNLPNLSTLRKQLSQVTITRSNRLKMMINKRPEGTVSPNLADALVMAYFPQRSIASVGLLLPKRHRGGRK